MGNTNVDIIEGEIWKAIPGFEGIYEISNLGRVYSLERMVDNRGVQMKVHRRMMKVSLPNNKRSHYYALMLAKNKQQKRYKLHRLIAAAFIPNPDNKPQVNHIDGNKLNNAIENLEWCTAAENIQHAYRTGLKSHQQVKNQVCGSRVPQSKLTESQIPEIRELLKTHRVSVIARLYGVNPNSIAAIKYKKAWAHI